MTGTVNDMLMWYERVHKEDKTAFNMALGQLGFKNTGKQHREAQAMGAVRADPWADNDECAPLSQHHSFTIPVQLPPIDSVSRAATPAGAVGSYPGNPPLTASTAKLWDHGDLPLEGSLIRLQSRAASRRSRGSRALSVSSLREHVAESVGQEVARVTTAPAGASRRDRLLTMLRQAKGLH
eukprot:gb/GFBE01012719.1/.p1 GENE.gb/GFBE01012719.1/~~gb/GFBE01012719.1/.p1  ORF type:complete len:181 (+),score=26.28 gb/GFBE01012719.1/:1-543(+)